MNQMENFKNPSLAVSGSSRKMANSCFLVWMWQMRLDTAIPALQFPGIAGTSRTRDVPHPQNSGKTIQMTFIPEGDVYRLIVHSK